MKRESRKWYKILMKTHLWIGLGLAIPFIMLGVTGSILVFEHEIEDIFTNKSEYNLAEGNSRSVEEIIAAAKLTAPKDFVPSMYRPSSDGKPASIILSPSKGQGQGSRIQILIDPVSLQIFQEESGPASILRTIKQLHANILITDRSGRIIIGWFGIAMFFLGISGLIMWWPRSGRWKVSFMVKKGACGFRLNRDLHGAVGIWGLLVFITVVFSGIYLAFPKQTSSLVRTIFPGRDLHTVSNEVKVESSGEKITADSAIKLAMDSLPGSRLLFLSLPSKPEQPYRINLARPDYRDGAPAISVFVDPWKGEIIEVLDPKDYTVGEIITSWQHAIHAGHGIHPMWKILVFLCGFMPLLFIITGFNMWRIKRQSRKLSLNTANILK